MGIRVLKPEDFSEEILGQVLALLERVAPKLKTFDAEEWRREKLRDPESINVIYQGEGGEVGAYILAVPHEVSVADPLIRVFDPQFQSHDIRFYYIDAIESDPKKNHGSVMIKLINTMVREANRRGVKNFSMHTRKLSGLSTVIMHVYPAKLIRTVENWYGFGEPFDYLEAEYDLLSRKAF